MKIATVGKGGSGKTTIAGTLVRIFAEEGRQVLAIDGDPNPNLAITLGMEPREAEQMPYVPATVMEAGERVGDVVMMRPTIPAKEILERFGSRPAEKVDLLVMGKPAHGTAGSGCMCASHRAVRGLIAELTSCAEHTVTDMEAGLEHLKRGTARHVDAMLVVAEPYYRSLEAAKRTCDLAAELEIPLIRVVANKVRGDEDMDAIRDFCAAHGMEIIGAVPFDQAMVAAEREGRAPFDHAPHSAGVEAIRDIAGVLDQLVMPESPAAHSREKRIPAE